VFEYSPGVVSDHEKVMQDIDKLLAGAPADLPLVERTLTDGYATALALETERVRLQKRVGALTAALDEGDVRRKSRELSRLAQEVELSEAALARLRALLARLRTEYSELVAAASRVPARGRRRR
jgi:hypothetical protein